MHIHFAGGIDTVTGSQHIIEANNHCVLRDCGLFQGKRKLSRKINRELPFLTDNIDAVVLSHAHIDHSGNLPSLSSNGYRGPIYATTPTAALCEIMLLDSAHIQEQDAAYLNQKTNRKGFKPVEPIYTAADAEQALRQFEKVHYQQTLEAAPGIHVNFREAGHILGAALNTFDIEENGRSVRIGYALDLGRKDLPMIRDPDILEHIDVLVIESTYGDRTHDYAGVAEEQLFEIVQRTCDRGGKVLIPSFALERAQEILYHLSMLVDKGKLPEIPVYLDSPMATAVTRIFEEKWNYMDEEYLAARKRIGAVIHPHWVHLISSVEDSKALVASNEPCIVISASGMCEHGRILHHLKHGVENPDNAIVIVGFQAAHTLGRRIVEQQPEIRIFGDMFNLNAEVRVLNAFSAHADKQELLTYVQAVDPDRIYLVHGEDKQRNGFAKLLRKNGYEKVYLPARGDVAEL